MRFIKNPKVSIIMGIYNCEETLPQAVDSLLSQTYSNIEIIMCDDGSTDNTFKIALDYASQHNNIVLLKNEKNEGLAFALNKCLESSNGTLIARQDGDDISTVDRIRKQVDTFLACNGISIVSTGTAHFDENGIWAHIFPPPSPSKSDFINGSPFCHGSAMIKKSSILAVKGYDSTKKSLRAEDYDLWFRMYATGFTGVNIQEMLYFVKDDRNAMNRRKFKYRLIEMYIRYKGYKLLKIPYRKYIYILRPLAVGFIPRKVYYFIRKKKYSY